MQRQRPARQHRSGRGEQGERHEHARGHRTAPDREQADQPAPRRECVRPAQAARDQGGQEGPDDRLGQRGGRQRAPGRQRKRTGRHRVRQRQGQRRVADVPQAGDLPGPHHPAAGPPQQRAGDYEQPEREHPDLPGAVQAERHVMRGEPERDRGPQHSGQAVAEAGVRGGDPADGGQRGQQRDAGSGHGEGRDRAGHRQRAAVRAGRRGPALRTCVRTGRAGRTGRPQGAGLAGSLRGSTHKAQSWQPPLVIAGRRAGHPPTRVPGVTAGRRAQARPGGRVQARRMASRARLAVPLGVRPTRTPAFSRASFLAWAVPDEPEMMAPACPIVLPSGAVKPAT